MSTTSLNIIPVKSYFSEITRAIARTKPGDRVALMTMAFNPAESPIQALMHEAAAAAKRGVHVQLNIDAHSFMVSDDSDLPTGPLVIRGNLKHLPEPYGYKMAILEELAASGGNYRILNWPASRFSNPFGGRSHIKCTVINDQAYLGGCNLSHAYQTDAMIRLSDPATVDWLYRFACDAGARGNVREMLGGSDTSRRIDDATTLLVDAGIKKQSLIYDQALTMIDQAKDWVSITCQFFPGNTTAKHLAAAMNRGVKVNAYFNGPRKHLGIKGRAMRLVQAREQAIHPAELFTRELDPDQPYLHAKLLATEQGAMIGSHNYVVQGVNFGTAEIALRRQDTAFGREVAALAKDLAKTTDVKLLDQN